MKQKMSEATLPGLQSINKAVMKNLMETEVELAVREATAADRHQLANLIHFEVYVHRHLDWRPPLDWLGREPYLVAERDGKIVAALACPPDPAHIAWVRLFAVSSNISISGAWGALWPEVLERFQDMPKVYRVAAIPLQNWLKKILQDSDFEESHQVVMLSWERGMTPPESVHQAQGYIRPMTFDDLNAVEAVDAASFVPEWQNSKDCLEMAFQQAAVATVYEVDGCIAGYQISTSTPMGGHLARLAVHPDNQRQGIGYALVRDMLSQFERRGAQRVTVNTQQDNQTSLALYRKAGFRLTGESYPVFHYELKTDQENQ